MQQPTQHESTFLYTMVADDTALPSSNTSPPPTESAPSPPAKRSFGHSLQRQPSARRRHTVSFATDVFKEVAESAKDDDEEVSLGDDLEFLRVPKQSDSFHEFNESSIRDFSFFLHDDSGSDSTWEADPPENEPTHSWTMMQQDDDDDDRDLKD